MFFIKNNIFNWFLIISCLVSPLMAHDTLHFSDETAAIKKGIYQHYKGAMYEVVAIAHHSETLEELVIYRMLYGNYGFWVRPANMFTETVVNNDEVVPRFNYLGEAGTLLNIVE